MKYYIFKRIDNNFKDILNDSCFKGKIYTKLTWSKHLMIGLNNDLPEDVVSYVYLKFGDDLVDFKNICRDRTPIRNKDYVSIEEQEYKVLLQKLNNKLNKEE